MKSHHDYEVVERKIVYQGIFRLVHYRLRQKLFKGGWSEVYLREVFERYSAAAVLPYDPTSDRVILIEQFRPGALAHPQSPWLIEIPAGVITGIAKPHEVAHQEAIEEAGCEIKSLFPICEYFVSPGASDEHLHLYCGIVDASAVSGVHGLAAEHEDIRVLNVTFDEAMEKLRAGKIKTSPAIIALLWLENKRKELAKL